MNDKERILITIISRIIPGLAYGFKNRDEYIESCILDNSLLKSGDLVYANSTITPNEFMVGFVDSVEPNYVVIREIGSKRLCNYGNESFTKINKEKLGYEILEGVKYTVYKKVLKAFSKYASYTTRFKSISFDGNICTVQARMMFENDTLFEAAFSYNSKTSVKCIGEIMKDEELKNSGDS